MFDKLLSSMFQECVKEGNADEANELLGKLKASHVEISPSILYKTLKGFQSMLIENFPFEEDAITKHIIKDEKEPDLDVAQILSASRLKSSFGSGWVYGVIVFLIGDGALMNKMLGQKIFGRRMTRTQQEVCGIYLFSRAMRANIENM
jgi:hypothetical protein